MAQGPTQPVEAPDDERVAGAQGGERLPEAGARCLRPRDGVPEDTTAPRLRQRVPLSIERLVIGRNTGIAYLHTLLIPKLV